MKRFLILLIAASLLLSACVFETETEENTVTFYYLRKEDAYIYGAEDGVVACEKRDPAGHDGDIRYLLTLYLQGPVDEQLRSPFPVSCRLLSLGRKDDQLEIILGSAFASLTGMDQTLAGVCLARTCFALTDAQSVRILARSSDGKITINQTITIDSLNLEDTPSPTEPGS